MERIRARLRETPEGDEPRRGRIREALVCPYCRDEVTRRATVVCARRGCGALYHRECWDECAAQYGGCAIYGCEARSCREVSVAGYLLRILRLILAAILFPPRIVQAIQKHEDAPLRTIYESARRYAGRIDPRTARGGDAFVCFVLYLIGLGPVLAASFFGILALAPFLEGIPLWGILALGLVALVVTVSCAIFLPVPVSLVLAMGFHGLRLAARALRAEVSALARADAGGGTVLGRLRLGLGKKA